MVYIEGTCKTIHKYGIRICQWIIYSRPELNHNSNKTTCVGLGYFQTNL